MERRTFPGHRSGRREVKNYGTADNVAEEIDRSADF